MLKWTYSAWEKYEQVVFPIFQVGEKESVQAVEKKNGTCVAATQH